MSSMPPPAPLYARLAVGLPIGLFAWFAALVPAVSRGEAQHWEVAWLPQLGISLGFHVDGLALLFALLITGIGSFILLYAAEYMRGMPQLGRFTAFLTAFMLSMLGLVLSDNLISLFVFWELTTLTSFLLIGYAHEDPTARRSALQSLLVTGAGALAMLAGFVLLGEVAGTSSLRSMLASPSGVTDHAHYPAILALVLLGAFTKSAQVPFHFWLPNAMAAPTPVSAYLHSATMVKAGVFLLARLNPVLGGTDAWTVTLTAVGAVTAVYSAAVALTRRDIKQVLAYTTVMALGVCVMFIGLPAAPGSAEPEAALLAAVGFIFAHALYKAALFMVAGTIDHATGTRDLEALGGLHKALPWTLAGATLAGLSMAGMWPTIGFATKELLYSSALGSPSGALAGASIFAASLMIAVAALVLLLVPFAGTARSYRKVPHEASWALRIGPLFLGCCGLLAGLFPGPVFHYLLAPAAAAASGHQLHFEASVWHGFSLPLALSLATLTLAALLFWKRSWWLGGLRRAAACLPWTGDRAYDAAMSGLASIAGWQTRLLQGGVQRRYLLIVFATLGAVLAGTIWIKDALALPAAWPQVSFVEWALALLIAGAALVTIWAKSRLLAICALGVVGTGTALVFLMHGAADVAMTQLMVETLLVVIVAMVLLKLPDFRGELRQSGFGQWRDGAVAATVGISVTLVLLAVGTQPSARPLTEHFAQNAGPQGFGQNVVNVILVDFRALDTLGEITVLATAAVAAFTLIRWRSRTAERQTARGRNAPEAAEAGAGEQL